MIFEALDNAGGVAYLERQVIENPTAFLALLGKLVPREISGPDGSSLPPNVSQHARVTYYGRTMVGASSPFRTSVRQPWP